ncbi:MAG: hypothetical protein M3536_08755, partial [Actinomycetota bacterium]|nr:hypothetical protein [Actinomycetota bacterium]
ISEAADAVQEASDTKALDVVARSGFAVMALLHMIVGAIAITLALGQPGCFLSSPPESKARKSPPGWTEA